MKKIIGLSVGIVLVLLLTYMLVFNQKEEVKPMYFEPFEVTRIECRDGRSGDLETIEDQVVIAKVNEFFRDSKIVMKENQEDQEGYLLSVRLIGNDNKLTIYGYDNISDGNVFYRFGSQEDYSVLMALLGK